LNRSTTCKGFFAEQDWLLLLCIAIALPIIVHIVRFCDTNHRYACCLHSCIHSRQSIYYMQQSVSSLDYLPMTWQSKITSSEEHQMATSQTPLEFDQLVPFNNLASLLPLNAKCVSSLLKFSLILLRSFSSSLSVAPSSCNCWHFSIDKKIIT